MNITNSILWKLEIYTHTSTVSLNVENSIIQEAQYSDSFWYPWYTGTDNIELDPKFMKLIIRGDEEGDYHLQDWSPAIGAGTASGAPTTDIEGNPRPNPADSNPDMGAYEHPLADPAPEPPSPFDLVYPFNDTTIVLTRTNFLDTLYFAWNQSIATDGDKITYRRELTGDLPEYIRFIVTSDEETTTNIYKVPYHHIEHYMHEAGVDVITGTWTVIATDGTLDTYADNGPFKLTIDGSQLGIEAGEMVPETFALHANYPNPFNPTTTISYDLPEQAQVTLGIYNLLGKQIKTLVNQSQDAGKRIAVWDGTDDLGRQVSAGVYLYQIQAGDFIQTRKMLLLK